MSYTYYVFFNAGDASIGFFILPALLADVGSGLVIDLLELYDFIWATGFATDFATGFATGCYLGGGGIVVVGGGASPTLPFTLWIGFMYDLTRFSFFGELSGS